MATTLRFSPIRTEIAGVPVDQLARRVRHADVRLRRGQDRRADRRPAGFRSHSLRPEGCSNLAILDLVRRHGVLVDAVSAGEIRRALAAGYTAAGDPPPIVYTADIFDARVAGPGRPARHPRQLRLARHDRPVRQPSPRAARSRCGSIPASATATAGRPTPAASNRSTASGTSNSTDCLRAADHHGLAVTGLHMHIGSGTDLEHLSQVCEAMEKLRPRGGAHRSARSAPAAGCRFRIGEDERYVDLDAYFQLWDAARKRLGRRVRPPAATGDRAGPIPGGRKRLPGGARSARSSRWAATRSTCSTPASTTWPGRSCMAPITRCRSCRADGDRRKRPMRDVVVGGPLCESGDIFTQEEGGFVSHADRCPRPRSANTW